MDERSPSEKSMIYRSALTQSYCYGGLGDIQERDCDSLFSITAITLGTTNAMIRMAVSVLI